MKNNHLRTFAVLILILFPFSIQAQKFVKAKYVTSTNDTLAVNLIVETNIFNSKLINELSFVNRLKIKNTEKKKEKIPVSAVKYLEFVDYKNNKRIFVAPDTIIKNWRRLIEQKTSGKISWYRSFSRNTYDGSTITTDYFTKKNSKTIKVGLFNSMKNKMKELILAERPDLNNEIEKISGMMEDDRDPKIMNVLDLYNNH